MPYPAAMMDSRASAARRQVRIRIPQRRGEQRQAERDEQQIGGESPHGFMVPPRAYTDYVIKHLNRFAAIVAITAASYAQTAPAKKSFQFHGKVTAVAADGVTVDGDKVEGWMEKMTMKYKVDDPKVLKTVKPGDEIKATVYEGDLTLHKVQVAAKK